jgi:hypothetical protein
MFSLKAAQDHLADACHADADTLLLHFIANADCKLILLLKELNFFCAALQP